MMRRLWICAVALLAGCGQVDSEQGNAHEAFRIACNAYGHKHYEYMIQRSATSVTLTEICRQRQEGEQ